VPAGKALVAVLGDVTVGAGGGARDAQALNATVNANIIRNFERDSMQGTVNLLGKIV